MKVALVRITLYAPHCQSLKERRAVVRKLCDSVMAKHKLRVSEVGGQDTWQRIELGFAVVGSDARIVKSTADAVVRMLEGLAEEQGVRRIDLQTDEQHFGVHREIDTSLEDWVPPFAEDLP